MGFVTAFEEAFYIELPIQLCYSLHKPKPPSAWDGGCSNISMKL